MPGYIPTEEAALVVWFADHAAGVSTHGVTVGLSAGEIAQAATDSDTVAHAVNGRSLYESKKQEFTAYKDILLYAPLNTPLPATPAPPPAGSSSRKTTLSSGPLTSSTDFYAWCRGSDFGDNPAGPACPPQRASVPAGLRTPIFALRPPGLREPFRKSQENFSGRPFWP